MRKGGTKSQNVLSNPSMGNVAVLMNKVPDFMKQKLNIYDQQIRTFDSFFQLYRKDNQIHACVFSSYSKDDYMTFAVYNTENKDVLDQMIYNAATENTRKKLKGGANIEDIEPVLLKEIIRIATTTQNFNNNADFIQTVNFYQVSKYFNQLTQEVNQDKSDTYTKLQDELKQISMALNEYNALSLSVKELFDYNTPFTTITSSSYNEAYDKMKTNLENFEKYKNTLYLCNLYESITNLYYYLIKLEGETLLTYRHHSYPHIKKEMASIDTILTDERKRLNHQIISSSNLGKPVNINFFDKRYTSFDLFLTHLDQLMFKNCCLVETYTKKYADKLNLELFKYALYIDNGRFTFEIEIYASEVVIECHNFKDDYDDDPDNEVVQYKKQGDVTLFETYKKCVNLYNDEFKDEFQSIPYIVPFDLKKLAKRKKGLYIAAFYDMANSNIPAPGKGLKSSILPETLLRKFVPIKDSNVIQNGGAKMKKKIKK